MNAKLKLSNCKAFLKSDIWDFDTRKSPWYIDIGIHLLRIVLMTGEGFSAHKVLIRATALSYTTILSIVPLLAVVFSLFKAFGGLETTTDAIKTFIFKNLATGTGTVVTEYIETFVNRYRTGTVGVVGLAALIMTVVALLTTIEKAFNDIWGIPRERSFIKRFTSYWALITIGPVLLGISFTITGALQSSTIINEVLGLGGVTKFFVGKLPYITTWGLFTTLYLIIPNTKVNFRAALIGGIIGGTLWEVAKWGYTIYAAKVVSYSSIYGSLAALPIFLLWIYYTWVVVLAGAEISFAQQNIHTYKLEKQGGQISQSLREFLALLVMEIVGEHYTTRKINVSAESLVKILDVPIRVVRDILNQLVGGRFLLEVEYGAERTFVPAAPLDTIKVFDIIYYLRESGERKIEVHEGIEKKHIEKLTNMVGEAVRKACGDTTIKELATGLP